MKCFNCGKELDEDSIFCMNCGVKVAKIVLITPLKETKRKNLRVLMGTFLIITVLSVGFAFFYFEETSTVMQLSYDNVYVTKVEYVSSAFTTSTIITGDVIFYDSTTKKYNYWECQFVLPNVVITTLQVYSFYTFRFVVLKNGSLRFIGYILVT